MQFLLKDGVASLDCQQIEDKICDDFVVLFLYGNLFTECTFQMIKLIPASAVEYIHCIHEFRHFSEKSNTGEELNQPHTSTITYKYL